MASYFEERDKDIKKIVDQAMVEDGVLLTRDQLEAMLANAWQHGWSTGFGWQEEIDRRWLNETAD